MLVLMLSSLVAANINVEDGVRSNGCPDGQVCIEDVKINGRPMKLEGLNIGPQNYKFGPGKSYVNWLSERKLSPYERAAMGMSMAVGSITIPDDTEQVIWGKEIAIGTLNLGRNSTLKIHTRSYTNLTVERANIEAFAKIQTINPDNMYRNPGIDSTWPHGNDGPSLHVEISEADLMFSNPASLGGDEFIEMVSIGREGVQGAAGDKGIDAKRRRCSGSEGRAAGAGGTGRKGGSGGWGGSVDVYLTLKSGTTLVTDADIRVQSIPGEGGPGGFGGQGGAGAPGKDCVVLGVKVGKRSPHPPGPQGATGPQGDRGDPGPADLTLSFPD